MSETPTPPETGQPAARPDTAAMSPRELAQAVLDRTIRPRVGEVRRLAAAILGKHARKHRKTAKASARKLAKIPGQAKKKKKK
ncbi:hypothetical protein ACOYW6_05725 [Parablastomonas sp. CN1-191]|uniref:hypothetical protein n=1 Tax=Parablastomonas sp. CN1-191 TaxID=3400908 RepID=UPI003BF80211